MKNSALGSQMKNKKLETRPLTAALNESDPVIYCGCDDFTAAPILRQTVAAFIFLNSRHFKQLLSFASVQKKPKT